MRMTRHVAVAVGVLLTLLWVGAAGAQEQGTWRYGFRVIDIGIDATSDPILDSDSTITIDSSIFAEYDMTYMLGQNWGVEWMITASPHDVKVESGAFDGLDLGSLWIAETTVTFNYMLPFWNRWRPYLGAGVSAAYFFGSDPSTAAEAIGVDKVKSELGWGFVGQVGLAYRLNRSWILTLDVKWIDMSIDVKLDGQDGSVAETPMDLDPLIIGLGGAVRF